MPRRLPDFHRFGQIASRRSTCVHVTWSTVTESVQRLPAAVWRPLARAHESRVDELTAAHRERRQRGKSHPIEDFLWRYYSFRPSQLRRWYPGGFVELEDAHDRAAWKFHRYVDGAAALDAAAFMAARGHAVRFVRDLVAATLSRPARLACFGLHEWAMVYDTDDIRHEQLPLRLGRDATDEVVERHTIRCSHYDAFRFFTESAQPLNTLAPTRDSQIDMEQPGCLHAGMDLYKHCYKLSPAISSDLTMRCFELALEFRLLDMQASPYDLADFGHEPVAIETATGRAEYVARQRSLVARSNALRRELIAECDALLSAAPRPGEADRTQTNRQSPSNSR